MITIKTLEVLVLACLVAQALLLVYLVVSARRFAREMTKAQKPGTVTKNIFIESALSLDL